MESNFNNLNVINTLLRWRVHLVVILVVAFIGAVIFSGPWIITPKFKSWAVIYPSNVSPYSEESETEQMFQLLQASYIRDMVIEKYDLPKHYEIAPEYKYFKTALLNEYRDHVNISKTPGEAIRIEVLDKDPVVAKKMVESIIYFYNDNVRNLHESKFQEVVAMWDRALQRKYVVLDSLKKQLATLAIEDGLIEYEVQAEELVKGILGTVEGGSTRINSKEVDRLKKNIQEKGGLLLITLSSLKHEAIILESLTNEYDIAYSNYDRQYTYTNVIEEPFAADKKSYPVRWLVVALTLFATLFLSLLIIGIIENIRIRKLQK